MERLGNAGDDYLKRFQVEASKKRGGVNSLSTELRAKTAEMLGVGIGQVAGLTKGWRNDQILRLYNDCKDFVNPPALWWKKYKELKLLYGRRSAQATRGVGQKRREECKGQIGQRTLFGSGETRSKKEMGKS